MRKSVWLISVLLGISLLLVALPALAQWGAIQSGVDAAKRAKEAEKKPEPAKSDKDAPLNFADDPKTGPVFSSPQTFKNTERNFTYTIPAGWKKVSGDPAAGNVQFGKPGTTRFFHVHYTQMVPSFPAKSAVDAGLKTGKEEITIGKLLAAKRKDQGGAGKKGIIGWEIVESRKGGGGSHQRIIWQCYDGDNYYYNFGVVSHPDQFDASKAELQGILDSIRFTR
ncbi:MAG: hypothetical protein FJ134_09945 [Deltaproteobacteria bacterium]|nr:hypothetical protein [Deltaproteobacteria bacterium]